LAEPMLLFPGRKRCRNPRIPDDRRPTQNFGVFSDHPARFRESANASIDCPPEIREVNGQKVLFHNAVLPLVPGLRVGHRIADCFEARICSLSPGRAAPPPVPPQWPGYAHGPAPLGPRGRSGRRSKPRSAASRIDSAGSAIVAIRRDPRR